MIDRDSTLVRIIRDKTGNVTLVGMDCRVIAKVPAWAFEENDELRCWSLPPRSPPRRWFREVLWTGFFCVIALSAILSLLGVYHLIHCC